MFFQPTGFVGICEEMRQLWWFILIFGCMHHLIPFSRFYILMACFFILTASKALLSVVCSRL